MKTEEHVTTPDGLADCEGFGVYGPFGRIGTVEAVRQDAKTGRPLVLSVRAGLLGSWLVHVPASEVEGVSLDGRRVVLRSGGLLARARDSDAGTRAA